MAAQSCQEAFEKFQSTSVLSRQRKLLDLQHLIRNNMDNIAKIIVQEQGKTMQDARGDVLRGLRK